MKAWSKCRAARARTTVTSCGRELINLLSHAINHAGSRTHQHRRSENANAGTAAFVQGDFREPPRHGLAELDLVRSVPDALSPSEHRSGADQEHAEVEQARQGCVRSLPPIDPRGLSACAPWSKAAVGLTPAGGARIEKVEAAMETSPLKAAAYVKKRVPSSTRSFPSAVSTCQDSVVSTSPGYDPSRAEQGAHCGP